MGLAGGQRRPARSLAILQRRNKFSMHGRPRQVSQACSKTVQRREPRFVSCRWYLRPTRSGQTMHMHGVVFCTRPAVQVAGICLRLVVALCGGLVWWPSVVVPFRGGLRRLEVAGRATRVARDRKNLDTLIQM